MSKSRKSSFEFSFSLKPDRVVVLPRPSILLRSALAQCARKEMAEAYGAKGMLTGWLVAQRITRVIGEGGTTIGVIENVQTGNHVAQIFEMVRGKSEEK